MSTKYLTRSWEDVSRPWKCLGSRRLRRGERLRRIEHPKRNDNARAIAHLTDRYLLPSPHLAIDEPDARSERGVPPIADHHPFDMGRMKWGSSSEGRTTTAANPPAEHRSPHSSTQYSKPPSSTTQTPPQTCAKLCSLRAAVKLCSRFPRRTSACVSTETDTVRTYLPRWRTPAD